MLSKNDKAWASLFEKYYILNQIETNGIFEISSTQINEFREARLMTKFDHKSQLPKLFLENELSILPITRGSYLIGKFEVYSKFERSIIPITQIDFPESIQSIDYQNITSESIALNTAFISDILNDFLDEKNIKPTVNGRMGSGEFEFEISTQNGMRKVTVENAQIEIDGGYEGENGLYLFEAKNSLSKDFLVRQLYYPFRLWANKISKPVFPVFLTYSNGIFYLRKYHFSNPENYNSIQLTNEKRYAIRQQMIKKSTIENLLGNVETVEEPEIAFPQADSFERIINLCELVFQNHGMTAEEITENYDFDRRQTNYYTDAARYLNLIKKEKKEASIYFKLTKTGKKIFKSPVSERQLKFAEQIISHQIFNQVLKTTFEKNRALNKREIVKLMKIATLHKIDSDSTYERRASTVGSWVNWMINLIEEPLAGDQLTITF